MAEGLREVAEHAAGGGIIFFRQKPDIVADRKQPLEQAQRIVAAADHAEGVDEPEAAGEERAFAWRQPVVHLLRLVAQQQAIAQQLALDRLDCRDIARIVRRDEADHAEMQQAGI